jgi:aspartate aminotransferase
MSRTSLLSRRARHAAPSPTLTINARFRALQAQGVDVVGFAAGEPDFDTPEHIKQAAIQALARGDTKYTPSSGTVALREAICEKLHRENGLTYRPDEIIVSAGAKHSLYNLFQALLDDGDEVIIPVPFWVSYPEQVKLAGGVPVFVPALEEDGFRVTAAAIAAAVTPRTRAVVVNSPSNPSGAVLAPEALREIAALAVERDLLLVSDEIYEHLTYGRPHLTIASLGPEVQARTLVVNGFSKAYSMTGWRLGWLAGNREVVAAMGRIQDQSTSNPTSFAQAGAVAALRGPQECVETMRREFERRRDTITARLNAMPGISCVVPEGAFYVLPSVAGLLSDRLPDGDAFTAWLLETHRVAVVPGSGFGVPAHVRLSYATDLDTIQRGMDRLEAAARELTTG